MLIVIGLYSVLWGKHKEGVEKKEEEIPEAIKGPHVNGNNLNGISVIQDIELANGITHDLKKLADHNQVVAIAMPIHQEPTKMNQKA